MSLSDKCQCVACGECGGTGNVWFTISGKYLGNHCCDDLDNLEVCEECHGSGLSEVCDFCRDQDEPEEASDWELR